MKIGMFTDTWLPTRDGCVTTIQKFRESLEGLGHDVFIFAPGEKSGTSPDDDRVFLFKARTFRQYPNYRLAFYPSKRKIDLILDNQIEVLHNHGIAFMALKAMTASRFLQIPCLLSFHTWVTDAAHYYPFNLREDLLIRLSWRYLRSLLSRSDGVIAPSRSTIEELKEKCPTMRYTNVVAPGIDPNRFNPSVDGTSIREKHGLGDATVLLHVGRVSKEKNLELIFDSLPRIKKKKPDVKLLVVGSGPAEQYYEALARQKGVGDDVVFTGFVHDDLLPKYYACADAFVIASPFETLGIVMIEALATGIPVAGLNHRVIPEVIDHGQNGYLFSNDPEDCARHTVLALDCDDIMRKNALETAKRFDNKECGKKLIEVYEAVLEIKAERIR
jgi:1,2-diacylglycerol 3-alpha-glucosyltransferase